MRTSTEDVAAATLGAVNALLDRDAVIAGGYARDTICGIPSKDIDIWFRPDETYRQGSAGMPYNPLTGQNLVASALRKEGYTVSNPRFITLYNEDVAMIWAYDITKFTVNGVSVDLICVKEPIGRNVQSLFDQFDFGLCMAAFRGTQVIYDERFQKDLDNKTITFYDTTREQEDMKRVLENHLPRLREKFPGFKVVGLEEFGVE